MYLMEGLEPSINSNDKMEIIVQIVDFKKTRDLEEVQWCESGKECPHRKSSQQTSMTKIKE